VAERRVQPCVRVLRDWRVIVGFATPLGVAL
jgi:hypothetical protein